MQTVKTPPNIERNLIIENPETRNFLADAYFTESAEKMPLVIFAHGYKGYKDWGAWDLMAKRFAEAGFFFVKFNFSHNGTTLENPTAFDDLEAFGNNNFSKEMLDYDAVLNHFSKRAEINPERIAVIGHSRGGGITLIKACEDERIKAVISLAGVSHFGYRFPSGDRMEEWKNSGVMYSENARTKQQMPHYYQFYEDYRTNEQRFSVQYAAQHLDKPLLIVQGSNDDAVKDKEAFLLSEWCKNSQLEILEGANHTFGASEPWKDKELPSHLSRATSLMTEFFKQNL
ncbi:alpha/beta hydrolase family protein [Kaistella pullorum]|uniref:Alpha/beta fold hydrolase n=1 Tax=Kaistella pullorum TaxID=2763074 RepID=A0ABR8WPQ2_9FLAO|nr:alpha/beta fold hydrolase [Kaistella pullorum]MBD8019039.1 alpha/beta fold hydrolase [Kaistella pullorum]